MAATGIPDRFGFEVVSGGRVEAAFDGGAIASDAGGLLSGLLWRPHLTNRTAHSFTSIRRALSGHRRRRLTVLRHRQKPTTHRQPAPTDAPTLPAACRLVIARIRATSPVVV
jgi:hypothetical protein